MKKFVDNNEKPLPIKVKTHNRVKKPGRGLLCGALSGNACLLSENVMVLLYFL